MPAADSNPSTSLSLIRRLAESPSSEFAWADFHQRYRSFLTAWCRRWGASQHEVDDIIQDSLMVVFRHLPNFQRQRNGSFRCWIKLVTLRAWRRELQHRLRQLDPNHLRDIQRHNLFGTSLSTTDDVLHFADQLANQEIFELAVLNVRSRVSPSVWDIFDLTEFHQKPIAEVARQFEISTTAVRVNNFRVRKLLRETIQQLNDS